MTENYLSESDVEIHILPRQDSGYPVDLILNGKQVFHSQITEDFCSLFIDAHSKNVGVVLGEALLSNPDLLYGWAQARRSKICRLRLNIHPNATELHGLPWELLRFREEWIAASPTTPFSRYLPVETAWEKPVRANPIRILVVISNPSDLASLNLPVINVEDEKRTIVLGLTGLDDGIEVEFLDQKVTLSALEEKLQRGYHILHFIGHGVLNKNRTQSALVLQRNDDKHAFISDDRISQMLRGLSIRPALVFLTACQSASRSPQNAFLGLAPRLIQAGVPAVIAMQGPLSMNAGQILHRIFYQQLCAGHPVDLSLNEARAALITAEQTDFDIPVLFMRSENGLLWLEDEKRQREIAYLRHVIVLADELQGKDVYIDMALHMAETKISIEAQSEVALRVLDRVHRAFKDRQHGQKDDENDSRIIDSFAELHSYVRESKGVAIIGDPGSGKTTTLNQLFRRFAISAIEQPGEPLPLFVHLSEYPGNSFDTFLDVHLRKHHLNMQDYLPDRLFLFLDGLNEMPAGYAEHIQTWIRDNPGVAVVITCRKLDYFGFYLPMNRVDIAPLDVKRIYEFLKCYLSEESASNLFWQLAGKEVADIWEWWQTSWFKIGSIANTELENSRFDQFWYGKIEKAEAWEGKGNMLVLKRLQDSLRGSGQLPGLLGIASNPFFLISIICLSKETKGAVSLYQNRGQLIAGLVDWLETKTSGIKPIVSLIKKSSSTFRDAMSVLAYQMQVEHTGTTVDIDWAAKTIITRLPDIDVENILLCGTKANVIDVVPGVSVRFYHQLLQEYFATLKLEKTIDQGTKAQEYWPGTSWWIPTGWEESVILLAGVKKDATSLLKWLIPVQPTLAFRCITEGGAWCASEIRQTLFEPSPGIRVSSEARFEWGKNLAERGDPRPGVGLGLDGLPDIDWCVVPEGKFLFGRQKLTKYLPEYKIARYPVTYLQFQSFVDAPDGYQNPTWWQGLPVSNTKRGWQEFLYDNHPRDNVSWCDAIAFCRWISAKTRKTITLPTELQWEKAARGSDGRVWPWGNEYLVGYANVDERDEHHPIGPSYLCSTTAVGMYPWGKSPYGIMDMCGNVWEWCLNEASEVDGTTMGNPTGSRQLRGGSWNNNIDVAPTYHRYSDWVYRPILPTYRNWRVGFRLVALD